MRILDELKNRYKVFNNGFRIYVSKKPRTDEEIIFEINAYQVTRNEKYRFFKENNELRMERDKINYKIEVIKLKDSINILDVGIMGANINSWIIDVTKIIIT